MPLERPFALLALGWFYDDVGMGKSNMMKELIDNIWDSLRVGDPSNLKEIYIKRYKYKEKYYLIFGDTGGTGFTDIKGQLLAGTKRKRAAIGRKNQGGVSALFGLQPSKAYIFSQNLNKETNNFGKYETLKLKPTVFANKIKEEQNINFHNAKYEEHCQIGHDSELDELPEFFSNLIPNEFTACTTGIIFEFEEHQLDEIDDILTELYKQIPLSYNAPNMRWEKSEMAFKITNKISPENKDNQFLKIDEFNSVEMLLTVYEKRTTGSATTTYCGDLTIAEHKVDMHIKPAGKSHKICSMRTVPTDYTRIGAITIRISIMGTEGLEGIVTLVPDSMDTSELRKYLHTTISLFEKNISKPLQHNSSAAAHSIHITPDAELSKNDTFINEHFGINSVKDNPHINFKGLLWHVYKKVVGLCDQLGMYNTKKQTKPWARKNVSSCGITDWVPYTPFIQDHFRADGQKSTRPSPPAVWNNEEQEAEEQEAEEQESEEQEAEEQESTHQHVGDLQEQTALNKTLLDSISDAKADDDDESEEEEVSYDDDESEEEEVSYDEEDEESSEENEPAPPPSTEETSPPPVETPSAADGGINTSPSVINVIQEDVRAHSRTIRPCLSDHERWSKIRELAQLYTKEEISKMDKTPKSCDRFVDMFNALMVEYQNKQ